ncbi:hypothetical protein pb186bvf_010817 [Paramecium bursaria]
MFCMSSYLRIQIINLQNVQLVSKQLRPTRDKFSLQRIGFIISGTRTIWGQVQKMLQLPSEMLYRLLYKNNFANMLQKTQVIINNNTYPSIQSIIIIDGYPSFSVCNVNYKPFFLNNSIQPIIQFQCIFLQLYNQILPDNSTIKTTYKLLNISVNIIHMQGIDDKNTYTLSLVEEKGQQNVKEKQVETKSDEKKYTAQKVIEQTEDICECLELCCRCF